MSTLTKVLIVLLTLASIFLCGIVVTYVSNAVDYKEKFDNQNNRYQAAQRNAQNAEDNFNKLKAETDQAKVDMNSKIAALEQRINSLNAELAKAQSDADLNRRLKEGRDTELAALNETVKFNDQLRANAETELKQTKAELLKEQAQYKETADTLMTKIMLKPYL